MYTEDQRGDLAELSRNRSRELWENSMDLIGTSRGTRLTVRSMLTECTGRSILDSGDHYGRGWERSALAGFPLGDPEPIPTTISCQFGDLEFGIDLSTYLGEFLEYSPGGDRPLQDYIADNPDSLSYWQDIQGFADTVFPKDSLTGIYGEGDPVSFNTYNEQNALNRDFQGMFFYTGDWVPRGFRTREPYLIFHTHNGADIRGGYGIPRCFTFSGNHDPESLFMWGDLWIQPEQPDSRFADSPWGIPQWWTDDSYHLYYGGYPDRSRSPFPMWIPMWNDNLPAVCASDTGSRRGIQWIEWESQNLEEYPVCSDPEDFPEETGGFYPGNPGSGVIVETGEGVHCPITGSPLQVTGVHGF